MKFGLSNSTEHLGTMRQRRMNRMKRQRAIEVGKPVDVSLKPMALNSPSRRNFPTSTFDHKSCGSMGS